jgi:tRNA A37 threonylcarbamoyladenosine synthetase subunit TsaC/SUA5/YrdC
MISNDIELAADFLNIENIRSLYEGTFYVGEVKIYSRKTMYKSNQVKHHSFFYPLIVQIRKIEGFKKAAIEIPETSKILVKILLTRPTTTLLKKRASISNLSARENQTVAVPLHKLNIPFTATIFIPFTFISPTLIEHLRIYYGPGLPLVLNNGICETESILYARKDRTAQITLFRSKRIEFLLFKQPKKNRFVQSQIILSLNGNLREVA